MARPTTALVGLTTIAGSRHEHDLEGIATGQEQRMRLADESGVGELARAVALSVEPKDMLEQMLVDQLAGIHNCALRLLQQSSIAPNLHAMTALANTAARMMDGFQRGVLALHRVRTNGQQTVVVQHVHVNGQAVVAGTLEGGGHRGGDRSENG